MFQNIRYFDPESIALFIGDKNIYQPFFSPRISTRRGKVEIKSSFSVDRLKIIILKKRYGKVKRHVPEFLDSGGCNLEAAL